MCEGMSTQASARAFWRSHNITPWGLTWHCEMPWPYYLLGRCLMTACHAKDIRARLIYSSCRQSNEVMHKPHWRPHAGG